MGLDVYFRRDIANVLRATACASDGAMSFAVELLNQGTPLNAAEQEMLRQAYRLGVRNTLLSVGLAFGLEPVGPSTQARPGASPPLAGLLWAEAPRDP